MKTILKLKSSLGTKMGIQLKRVYDSPAATDGKRILIDRLWPRGLTKEKASVGLWLKEIAPSTELRQWFSHDPQKWPEFQERYRQELQRNAALVAQLRAEAEHGIVTLVYGAKDTEHNDALVLKKFLQK